MHSPVRLPDHIRTLLLDLDGTLLDLAFDTHFWLEVVPASYGARRGMSAERALREEIAPRLRDAEGTLNWYSLDYWSRMLEMDLSALKVEHDTRIAWLPGAREFLARQRSSGRRLVLATTCVVGSLIPALPSSVAIATTRAPPASRRCIPAG